MKKTFTTLGMGACVLLAFNSCQSTDKDGYYGPEEAIPMSEFGQMTVAEGEIPPWLLEDSGDIQVDAGATTHNENTFPDLTKSTADTGSRASTSQNQPNLASGNDVTIETFEDDIIVAPLEDGVASTASPTPSIPGISATTPKPGPVYQPVEPKETASSGALKTATADARKTTAGKKGSKAKKPTQQKKPTKPTMVAYKVKPGDNLSMIARRSNTTVEAIRKASGLRGDKIFAGSTIQVPYTPDSYKMAMASKAGKPAKETTHVVKRGESLSQIASRNGVTTQALLKANKMSTKQGNVIRPGQKLIIPGKGTAAESAATPAATKSRTHVVKRGETLSKIASQNGVTTQALLKANGLTAQQATRIRPGQKLTIPGKAASTTKGTKGSSKSKGKKRRS